MSSDDTMFMIIGGVITLASVGIAITLTSVANSMKHLGCGSH